MGSLNAMRRRAMAGAALIALVLPGAGALAQDSGAAQEDLPPCSETVQQGGSPSEFTGAITGTNKAFGVSATLHPVSVIVANGYSFADGELPLTIAVPPGALTRPAGGQIDAQFAPPVLMRGGAPVKGTMSATLAVGDVSVGAESEQPDDGDARSYSLSIDNSVFGTPDPVLTLTYTAENRTVATITYSGALVREASQAFETMRTRQLARYDAGQCAPVSQGCFLTTAACEVVGLADDCWELRTLRRFRDGWLARQADGRAHIARYYAEAPAIADRLRQDRRAALMLYWTRIVPSALAAQCGLNRAARAIYTRGMRELLTRG